MTTDRTNCPSLGQLVIKKKKNHAICVSLISPLTISSKCCFFTFLSLFHMGCNRKLARPTLCDDVLPCFDTGTHENFCCCRIPPVALPLYLFSCSVCTLLFLPRHKNVLRGDESQSLCVICPDLVGLNLSSDLSWLI